MNILTLFKRMWALFVFASMLLALIAKPFLALLSLLFSGEDGNDVTAVSEAEGRPAWTVPGEHTVHFSKPGSGSISFMHYD